MSYLPIIRQLGCVDRVKDRKREIADPSLSEHKRGVGVRGWLRMMGFTLPTFLWTKLFLHPYRA